VDVGKNYLKEVERRGYIPFRVDDYSVGDLSSYEQSSNMSLMNALPLTNVVPVTVWIYRRNDGTGGITQAQAEAIMAGVRNIFDPTGIRIYMLCQVQFVNSTQFFTLDNRNE